MNAVSYSDVVQGFLRDRIAPMRFAEETLARLAGVTPRTARNWLRGECAPQGEHLLTLMAECDDLAERVMAAVAARREEQAAASAAERTSYARRAADLRSRLS